MTLHIGTGQGVDIVFDADDNVSLQAHPHKQELSEQDRKAIISGLRSAVIEFEGLSDEANAHCERWTALADRLAINRQHVIPIENLRSFAQSLLRTAETRNLNQEIDTW